ncbi:MAG: hypothetical protein H0V96_05960 [Acidimicrobiia bacterium]|nr:hypothetical protein [Acidimicrobiia bacterium]
MAEIMFNQMEVDAFFLEYDDERSGDFRPLRFMPGDKTVVLGLMSSKHPRVEDADEIKRRIDEAAVYVPPDQLALSHQCGFSSTAHGNAIPPPTNGANWRARWRSLATCGTTSRDADGCAAAG